MSSPIDVAFLVPDDRFGRNLPRPIFGSAPTALLRGFNQLGGDRIRVHVISCVEKNLPAPTQLESNIFYRQIVIPHWRFLRTLHSGPVLQIRRLLKSLCPHIVHAHGVERWCAISGALSGIPSLLTIHGHLRLIQKVAPMEPKFYWRVQTLLGDFSIPRFKGVVCISRHIQAAANGHAKRTWLIPNALREEFLVPLAMRPPNEVPQLLVVGTVVENKQTLEILRALKRVFVEGGRFHVTFCGQLGEFGEYQRSFRRELAEAEAAGFASNGGSLAIEALRDLMDGADALVHFPKEEAFGLVVGEALARGLAVFAAEIGGILDIVEHAENVELFPVHDFDGLAIRLREWLKDRPKGSKTNRDLMEQKFSPIRVAEAHLDAYHDVLKS